MNPHPPAPTAPSRPARPTRKPRGKLVRCKPELHSPPGLSKHHLLSVHFHTVKLKNKSTRLLGFSFQCMGNMCSSNNVFWSPLNSMILLAVKRKILSKNLIGIALQNHVDLEKQQQAKTEPGSLVRENWKPSFVFRKILIFSNLCSQKTCNFFERIWSL